MANSLSTGSLFHVARSQSGFRGVTCFYTVILGTIMIPSTALVLPLFLTMNRLGILNTPWAFIVPSNLHRRALFVEKIVSTIFATSETTSGKSD